MGQQPTRDGGAHPWWTGLAVTAIVAVSGVVVSRTAPEAANPGRGISRPVAGYEGPNGFIVYGQDIRLPNGKQDVDRWDLPKPTLHSELFLQRLPGGRPVLLTDAGHRPVGIGRFPSHPLLDSTGRYVAFITGRPGSPFVGHRDRWVWMMDLKERSIRPMPTVTAGGAPLPAFDGPYLAWSKEGSMLAVGFGQDIRQVEWDPRVDVQTPIRLAIWDIASDRVDLLSYPMLSDGWDWVGERIVYAWNGVHVLERKPAPDHSPAPRWMRNRWPFQFNRYSTFLGHPTRVWRIHPFPTGRWPPRTQRLVRIPPKWAYISI